MPPSNPATLAQQTQDERIPGLPTVAVGTDRTTLLVPAYNPATDKTEHVPLTDPADGDGGATAQQLADHLADHANPHQTTKYQVGLGNVPNVDATDRAHHTGTQPAVSISDFVESVRALLHVAGGVLAYDAATGTFSVQAAPVFAGDVFSSGPGEFGGQAENADRLVKRSELVNYLNKWSWKQLVKGATQVNVNLAGPAPGTVDGITFGPGRWLVRAQTNAAENGIYTYSVAGGWVRSPEADTWGELVNATVFVSQGTNSHDKLYTCTVDEGGTLGTDPVAWQMIGAATVFQFGSGFTVTGNSITVDVAALKTLLAYTKADVGLGNADNTPDASKPVSGPQQTALDVKQNLDMHSVLAYAASVSLDFAADNQRTITLSGNLTFAATANRAATRQKVVRLLGGSSPYTLAFPSGWTFLGAGAPTGLAAGKTAILSLYCYGAAESDVVAAYAVQQ